MNVENKKKAIKLIEKIKKVQKIPDRSYIIKMFSVIMFVNEKQSMDLLNDLERNKLVSYKGNLVKINDKISIKEIFVTELGLQLIKR